MKDLGVINGCCVCRVIAGTADGVKLQLAGCCRLVVVDENLEDVWRAVLARDASVVTDHRSTRTCPWS